MWSGLPRWLSGKASTCQCRRSLGQEDSLAEETATHSSILAWEIPWEEEAGGLQSMRTQKSQTWLSTHSTQHKEKESWAPTPHPSPKSHICLFLSSSLSIFPESLWLDSEACPLPPVTQTPWSPEASMSHSGPPSTWSCLTALKLLSRGWKGGKSSTLRNSLGN